MKMRYKDEWSRVVVYLLIITFGLYSTVYPIISVDRSSPEWATILLGVEFATAGFLLLAGVGRHKGYRMAGLVVVAVGLFTISAVIAVAGGTRVLAYAFLFGAFAMDAVHEIRQERIRKREGGDPEELRRLLRELRAAQLGRTER